MAKDITYKRKIKQLLIDGDKFIPWLVYSGMVDETNCGDLKKAIELCTVTDVISIPNHITNGDMIMILFPNAKIWEINQNMAVEFPDMLTIRLYPLSWWNAKYKGEEHD